MDATAEAIVDCPPRGAGQPAGRQSTTTDIVVVPTSMSADQLLQLFVVIGFEQIGLIYNVLLGKRERNTLRARVSLNGRNRDRSSNFGLSEVDSIQYIARLSGSTVVHSRLLCSAAWIQY